MGHRILVIEDNCDMAELVAMHLRDAGATVDIALDGHAGLQQAREKCHDLIVLDLMLPGIDGLSLCRELRQQDNMTPILMLTARSTELDRVIGLELGADDYLTKPFSLLELMARIKAILRRVEVMARNRARLSDQQEVLHAGEMKLDRNRRTVWLGQQRLDLTAKEFDLLWHFAHQPGRVFTRSQLLDSIWGYGHEGYEHTVNSHINRLRAKIETDPSRPRYILTVWGVGYKFAETVTDETP
jgi:DNA-binding response OmpR family regulator